MPFVNPMSLIPPQYKLLAYLVIAALIFGAGSWTGYKLTKNHYTAIVATMKLEAEELKRKQAELQSALTAEIANVKEVIVTKYVDRVKIVKEKEYVYRDQATHNVPAQYELSNGWVSLHDNAARGTDADATGSSDATSSGVKDNQALAVVVENYAACNANAEQLTSLQEFVREAQKAVERANAIIKNGKGNEQ